MMNKYSISVLILLIILIIFLIRYRRNWFTSDISYSFNNFIEKFSRKLSLMFELRIPINKKIAKEGLGIIHDVFDESNIFFWLSEGTALGYTRDNDIIDWDDDVDVGIYGKDKDKLLNIALPKLIKRGFKTQFGIRDFVTLSYKGVDYDIDITAPDLFCISICNKCDGILSYLKKFKEININNKKYNLPHLDYVKRIYGEEWNIPKKREKPGLEDCFKNLKI